ncbi:MAG: T9SS type A sorting domain-containing protein [Pontibacter sp.]|nr:T9SS type A sorting domain-containing protein [Pontibacter sp.]
MKTYLYLLILAGCFSLSGCGKAEPEPDFSGVQTLTYTVQQTAGSTAGPEVQLAVNPNPFFDDFSVSLNAPSAMAATVYVSDEKGRYKKEIETTVSGYTHIKINFSEMPKGVYLCEVHLAGQVSRYRMIKAW